ncbi:MAG TPA: preprotein translocase subunit SecE [Candidatus Saccharimonadales bacterium]|nr:preprotein translocase subunit SecE [Candidatus Saccharimonadales bacterium]
MADDEQKPKKRQLRKVKTVRERAEQADSDKGPRRLKQAGTSAIKPLRAVARTGRKEYYLPIPDNKVGRFMNKRRRLIPRYFSGAWEELRQVKWPGRKETAKLTFAVFMFAIFIGTIITLADFGLDKVFKRLFLK